MSAFTTRDRFQNEVFKLLAEARDRCREQLEHNHPQDMTAYIRGQVWALRQMEDIMEQAQENIDKRNS